MPIMDAATFRTQFPEFANTTTFPTSQIDFWSGIGEKLLRPEIWLDLYNQGLSLFTAHHLSIAAQNAKAAASGGVPGATTGMVASKAVDKVSISYTASEIAYKGAGFWNLTTYGLQFWNLVRMFGAGGIQVTGGPPLENNFPIWSNPVL